MVAAKALRSLAKSEANCSACYCLLEEHVYTETAELVKTFPELSKKGITTCTVANVARALCFGNVIQMSHDLIKASCVFNPADSIPCLRYLLLPAAKVARALYGNFNNFVAQHVEDHYVMNDKNVLRDITDALINISNEKKVEETIITLSNEKIIIIVNDIFGTGFGTLSSCLQWIFLYLINNSKIQMKIQEVIVLPRITFLNSYYIPQNTCIFINMYQVNHDENLWLDPDVFKPQRFLNENGELNKSLVEKILTFGMRLQKCLGEEVVRNEILVILTAILQQLRLEKLFEDQLDITPVCGLSMTPKPYRICGSQRA